MSYFADLTPHTYVRDDAEQGTILNVGWLDGTHEFPQGDVSVEFLESLREICLRPMYLHRGSHQCEICGNYDWTLYRANGNGQIRVLSREGVWYAAPTMVHHYVMRHRYRPPEVFIETVLEPSAVALGKPLAALTNGSFVRSPPQVNSELPPKLMVLNGMPIDAWRIDRPPWPQLSPGARRRLEILFAKQDQAAAIETLANAYGNGRSQPIGPISSQTERLQFAALKLSGGNLERLKEAIELGHRDFRDLLMAAGFGEVTAHQQWLAEPGAT
jgi:hypothetical protein